MLIERLFAYLANLSSTVDLVSELRTLLDLFP